MRNDPDAAIRQPDIFSAVDAGDLDEVRRLLASGANPRIGNGRESPLHVAARTGPLALVEVLIAGGALAWQPDASGKKAIDAAKAGNAPDREAIVALLDRDAISDASFRAAVEAVQRGDVAELSRLLDAEPRLLHERILGPDVYRKAKRPDYFRDPKLFWFVANNPTLVDATAPNMVEVVRAMIERGVSQDDLDYALGLTATGSPAHPPGLQAAIMRELIGAGAVASGETILAIAAHWQYDALRELLAAGYPMTAAIAAALGRRDDLRTALSGATPQEVQDAFGLAVINGHLECALMALDAGADVNAWLPVHAHSTALHQVAIFTRPDMIEALLVRGARRDIADTLWGATPLGWAVHGRHEVSRKALEAAEPPP